MTAKFWNELNDELQKGISEHGHPFRYATLGTIGLDKIARLRTVVIREVSHDQNIVFFTDKRSKKVTHIKENPNVSLLLYHPEKLLQIRIEGLANIHVDEKTLSKYWNRIQAKGKKDYTTKYAPGSTIKNPDEIEYLDEHHHFCMITIVPFKLEYLKLKRPNHIRVKFSKNEDLWVSEFLVP
ncbi:pyridoxamine 5'-phosphate oxidase family protein [Maribacter sp. CXY002]|uniref:pyridoxamine 5'-phosphate oxidase family protein n=1 Tax=Maribacter luteocoastalis TaxID=3407671 RepID=UPI003B66C3BE